MILSMVVLKLKEYLEAREISLYRVGKDTGIAYTTLLKMKQKKNKSVDLEVLGKLCDYFKCELANLLALEK